MKKIFIALFTLIILSVLPIPSSAQPVGIIHEPGEIYQGDTLYFVDVNLTSNTGTTDTFKLALLKGDYLASLPLSQLKSDLANNWTKLIPEIQTQRNTLIYLKEGSDIIKSVTSEDYSVSQIVLNAARQYYDIDNAQISSTAYLDNNIVLSNNVSNEDGHIMYDAASNTMQLHYTYDISEQTIFINENGVSNEYLLKRYNMVVYRVICMAVDLTYSINQPTPTPTSTPTPTPTLTPTPTTTISPTPSVTVTPSSTTSPSPSPSPSSTQPVNSSEPSTSIEPSPTSSPSPSPSPSPTPRPDVINREDKRYDDIWTFVILQALIIIIIIIIVLSRKKRH